MAEYMSRRIAFMDDPEPEPEWGGADWFAALCLEEEHEAQERDWRDQRDTVRSVEPRY